MVRVLPLETGLAIFLARQPGPAHELRVPVVARKQPFHLRDVLPMLHPVAEVVLPAAPVVVRPRDDPRRHLERVGPEAGFDERQLLLELGVDVQRAHGLGHLEHRRLARDGDRLLQRAELHDDVHLEVGAGAQQNAFAAEHGEPGQFRRQRVGAGR
jgi:hypothetical protein